MTERYKYGKMLLFLVILARHHYDSLDLAGTPLYFRQCSEVIIITYDFTNAIIGKIPQEFSTELICLSNGENRERVLLLESF